MRVVAASLLVAAPALVSAAVTPVRRSIPGFATFYYTQTGNPGSCGSYLDDSAYTVAMNSFQYNDAMCGQTVTITANGKTAQAKVMDLCPAGGGNCNYGDMDFSPSLFQYFADLSVGKFPMQWDFADGSAPATTPNQDTSSYVEPPSPTVPTQDSTPVVAPPPPTTPIIDSSPVYENSVPSPTDVTPPADVAPAVDEPTPTSDYVDPTPTPWTDTTDCSTTTDSASAATATTTPSFGDQIAMAMQDHNVTGLGAVLVELGKMLQNSTNTNTSDTATTATY